jgi:transcriptional regulator with XRE-family HTH domain
VPQKGVKVTETVDQEVGRRIRAQRVAKGMSQGRLGEAIGVTFQQVQKYEKGFNRVGSSRLQKIADHLGVQIGAFYKSMDRARPTDGDGAFDYALVQSTGAIRLLRGYAVLESSVQHAVVELVEAIVSERGNRRTDKRRKAKEHSQ